MTHTELRTILNGSNISEEDQARILDMFLDQAEENKSLLTSLSLIVIALKKELNSRTFKKIIAEINKSTASCIAKEICFHKFDYEELSDSVIRAAFLKNVIGDTKDYGNFVERTYVTGMILSLKDETQKNLDTLITKMSEMYDLARTDNREGTDIFGSALCSIPDTKDYFLPMFRCSSEERLTRTLSALNKLKDYNNSGKEMYKVVVNGIKMESLERL